MQAIQQFHKTKSGHVVFGLVELGISYWFASLAINSGRLVQWVLALIFFVGFLQNLGRLIGKIFHGGRQTS